MLLYHPLSSASKRSLRSTGRLEDTRKPRPTLRRSASKSAPERPRREPKRRSPAIIRSKPKLFRKPSPRARTHPKRRRTFALSLSRPLAPFHAWPRTPWPRTCPGTACTKRATPLPTVVKSHVFSVNTRRAFCRLFPPLRARLTRLCNACRVQRRPAACARFPPSVARGPARLPPAQSPLRPSVQSLRHRARTAPQLFRSRRNSSLFPKIDENLTEAPVKALLFSGRTSLLRRAPRKRVRAARPRSTGAAFPHQDCL